MFTAQDILDIAIRLEKNGEKTYREAMRETDDEALQEQLAAFQLALTIARFEKPDAATEEKAYGEHPENLY